MQVSLIDTGTSKGIRIPSSVLKEMDKPQSFELRIEEGSIVLDVLEEPCMGQNEKFKDVDNALLIDDTLDMNEWDEI